MISGSTFARTAAETPRVLTIGSRASTPILLGLLLTIAGTAFGQAGRPPESNPILLQPVTTVETVRRTGPVVVDGVLDEPTWTEAPVQDAFLQREPEQGAAPTERTEVRILFDEDALYVGARLYDRQPDSIVARLGRRDAEMEADLFGVFLDPYNDDRTGYYFGLNPAGTLYDGILMNDDWDDSDWDGIWEGRTAMDDLGWTAELRIPFSQLRFFAGERPVWGINFRRTISRKQEHLYLAYTPRQESGFVSRFPDLIGLADVRPVRHLEITPYLTSKARYTDQPAANPFDDGSRYLWDAGADLEVGLTSNVTLNGTINPDFGQVEVDPAVINLSDFETYFPEKRPFFIEGGSTFGTFGFGGARENWGFNWGNPIFFYTRRIGRAPSAELPDHEYADVPEGTRILGAARATGQVGSGINVGTVHAVTAREHAELSDGTETFRAEAEPAAYYSAYRAQREIAEGRYGTGLIGTYVDRFFDASRLREQFGRRAITVGADGWAFVDPERTWVLSGWGAVSDVRGSEAYLLGLQQSSRHYFQRPDADHVGVDSSATGMAGWAGRLALNKQRGRVIFNAAAGAVSPSFEINDLGFQSRSDVLNGHAGIGYSWPNPGRWTRDARVIGAVFRSLDFDGNTVWSGVWGHGSVELPNYYDVGLRFAWNPETVNNRRTRGGPLTLNPPGWESGAFVRSDSRERLVVGLNGSSYTSGWRDNREIGLELEYKPAPHVSVRVSPEVEWTRADAQWVDAFDDPLAAATFGRRYVFARLDQRTFSSSVRLNWTFRPELSLQLFAQPLVSRGNYFSFRELVRPRSFDFRTYGTEGSTFDPDTRTADPDGPGAATPIEIPDPDFTVSSLRGTAVLRWKYTAGSTLYLVWTQQASGSVEDGRVGFLDSLDQLVHAHSDHVFLAKLTYVLGR